MGRKKKLMLYITAVVILSKIKYFSSRNCLGVYDFHIIYVFMIFIFLDFYCLYCLSKVLLDIENISGMIWR